MNQQTSRNRQRIEVRKLIENYNLSQTLAYRVVNKEMTLKEAIVQQNLEAEIDNLVSEHQLNRSLATQIVHGQLDKDLSLRKHYSKRHLVEHKEQNIWDKAIVEGATLRLYLHGQIHKDVKVVAVDAYMIQLDTDETIHKLQIKMAHWITSSVVLNQLEAASCPPIERPENRFRMSNVRLYQWFDSKTPLLFDALEGLQATGVIQWFNQWEIKVQTDNGPLHLFRHALSNISRG